MARKYRVRMKEFDIGAWEFQEAEAMARRYPAMRRRLDMLDSCRARAAGTDDARAMRWECAVVERALKETDGGQWETALRKVCCEGKAYADVDAGDVPTSNRNDFFRARREFFFRLWQIRTKQLGEMMEGGTTI